MFDFQANLNSDECFEKIFQATDPRPIAKRCFDYVCATLLLVPLALLASMLMVVNPFLNRGPLWFVQDRMGHRCQRFRAIKFRTMTVADGGHRGAFDGLEKDRITVLGRILRKSRIDELPQIINILRGEMSLIGPRPDAYAHALIYTQSIPGYRARHEAIPGISGLAQTEVGYVDGRAGVHRKVAADLRYIANVSLRLELWIVWRTLVVVMTQRGV